MSSSLWWLGHHHHHSLECEYSLNGISTSSIRRRSLLCTSSTWPRSAAAAEADRLLNLSAAAAETDLDDALVVRRCNPAPGFAFAWWNADSRHDVDGSAITLDLEASDTMDNVKAKQATRGSQDTAGLQLPEGGTRLLRQSALRPRWRCEISPFHLEGQRFGVTRTKTWAPSQGPSKRFGVWDPQENPGHRPKNGPIAIACDRNCFQSSPTMSFARKKS